MRAIYTSLNSVFSVISVVKLSLVIDFLTTDYTKLLIEYGIIVYTLYH